MMTTILIALAAGSASALMFASIVSGALISLVLFYLAPLPLMVAALGWGPLAATVDETLATDDLIARADELISAGLGVDAGQELARGEKAFLARAKSADRRGAAFAMLLDRYRKAGNYVRPWMLAVSYSGSALDGPPQQREVSEPPGRQRNGEDKG